MGTVIIYYTLYWRPYTRLEQLDLLGKIKRNGFPVQRRLGKNGNAYASGENKEENGGMCLGGATVLPLRGV